MQIDWKCTIQFTNQNEISKYFVSSNFMCVFNDDDYKQLFPLNTELSHWMRMKLAIRVQLDHSEVDYVAMSAMQIHCF